MICYTKTELKTQLSTLLREFETAVREQELTRIREHYVPSLPLLFADKSLSDHASEVSRARKNLKEFVVKNSHIL